MAAVMAMVLALGGMNAASAGGGGTTDPAAGSTGDSPVFINDSTPGSLTVEKNVDWDEYDEDADFKFKVMLTTPGEKDVTGDWSYKSKEKPVPQAFAVYSADDNSLRFYNSETIPSEGDTYSGRAATNVYTDIESWSWSSSDKASWHSIASKVTKVVVEDSIQPANCAGWFSDMTRLTDCDVSKLDTSKVNSMYGMFNNCLSLTSLDVSGFETSNVQTMAYMFSGCSGFTTLDLSYLEVGKLWGMNMDSMFSDCSALLTLDITGWDMSHVSCVSHMFYNCSNLVLDCSGWDMFGVYFDYDHYDFNTGAPGVIAPFFYETDL